MVKWITQKRTVKIVAKDFDKKFTRYRIDNWFTIMEACERLKISHPTYKSILKGKGVEVRTLKKIREIIDVDFTY